MACGSGGVGGSFRLGDTVGGEDGLNASASDSNGGNTGRDN